MNTRNEQPSLTALLLALAALELLASTSLGQTTESSRPDSLMANVVANSRPVSPGGERHLLLDTSMFAIAPPEVREFKMHDLVQIIVRESSQVTSKQELTTGKQYDLDASVSAFPSLSLTDLLNFQVNAGRTDNLPSVEVGATKDFEGDGEYKRKDDLTARLTGEIIEILPNGNLVLEARTKVKTDDEISEIRVTGICRPDDISAANTVLSSALHDLNIEKDHEGELRESNRKGILAQILDTIFAF